MNDLFFTLFVHLSISIEITFMCSERTGQVGHRRAQFSQIGSGQRKGGKGAQ
jgi:hypothetical protein